jgi:DNA-binding XRE family transcriptional regulator
MALFLNRPLDDLLVRSRRTLGMTQRTLGEALGASLRTAQRWDSGAAHPGVSQVRTLARLVFPIDPALAAELASAASETLVTLGLVPPPPPPQPALPVVPRSVVIDSIVCAAAEAARTHPTAVRAGLLAALAQARGLNVSIDELEKALGAPAS